MSDGWFAAQNLDLEKIKINEEKRRKSSISSKKKFFTRQKMSPTRVVHSPGMEMVPSKNVFSILIYNQQLQNEATSDLIFCVAGIFCRKIVDHISNFVSPFLLQTRRTRIRHGGLGSK
jgi:hypothetical protein